MHTHKIEEKLATNSLLWRRMNITKSSWQRVTTVILRVPLLVMSSYGNTLSARLGSIHVSDNDLHDL